MLQFLHGNILYSNAQALVNPVNTMGVAGAGLALAFRKRYPEGHRAYGVACMKRQLFVGTVLPVWVNDGDTESATQRLLIYAPTKTDWRKPSRVEYVEKSLDAIRLGFPTWGVDTIALPALGCGLGGLDYHNEVRPLIEKYMGDVQGEVHAYLPA